LICVEIFAGAGGLALGLEQAGFKHSYAFERDQYACETLRKHFKLPVQMLDITQACFREFCGETDLLAGGPPCQPFSAGGIGLGRDDPRDMFPHAVRAVSEIQPKAFVFENVEGLLYPRQNEYFNYVLRQLERPKLLKLRTESAQSHNERLIRSLEYSNRTKSALHYRVQAIVLNAADFGVPQVRKRVFIVGVRSDVESKWQAPIPTHSKDALLKSQESGGMYRSKYPHVSFLMRPNGCDNYRYDLDRVKLKPWVTVRDAISVLGKPLAPSIELTKLESQHQLVAGAKSYPGHDGSSYDWPSKTIKAGNHGNSGGENTLRGLSGTVRYFTLKECAALQSFPKSWVFGPTRTAAIRQIGNAVPPLLARAVGLSLARLFR
jgi:DNA (cytosine-5)-methyltransferase 1